MPVSWSERLSPGSRFQVQVGLVCGALAMAAYAAKGGTASVETRPALAVRDAVPLGEAVRAAHLVTVEVPATVAADYLPDDEATRAWLDRRRPRVALDAGARLVPSMFPGHAGEDDDLPPGHRLVPLKVERLPEGVDRGVSVDLFAGRQKVAEDALVMAVDPFTVALPVGSVLRVLGNERVTVLARPDDDAGSVADPPPPRARARPAPGPARRALN